MNARNLVAVAILLCLGAVAGAVEPPPDPGTAVLCVFDAPELPAENFVEGLAPFTVVTLHFVLYYPVSPSGLLGAVEFGWQLQPPVEHVVLAVNLPEYTINVGNPHELILGYGHGAPVVDGHAYLASVDVMFMTNTWPTYLHLVPIWNWNPSVPGQMAYVDQEQYEDIQVMVPYSEGFSHESPVFGFNAQPVTTETATWGGVKSLFR